MDILKNRLPKGYICALAKEGFKMPPGWLCCDGKKGTPDLRNNEKRNGYSDAVFIIKG